MAESAGAVAGAVRSSRNVHLVEFERAHLGPLHAIAMEPTVRSAWRTRGRAVAPSEWEAFLLGPAAWTAVGVQVDDGTVLGCAELTDVQLEDGHASFGLFAAPDRWRRPEPTELAALFLQEVFHRYPAIRKLYATVHARNARLLGSLGERFTTEGVLVDFVNLAGQPTDVHVISIGRSQFDGEVRRMAGLLGLGPPDRRVGGAEDTAVVELVQALRPELTLAEASALELADLDSLDLVELVSFVEVLLDRELSEDLLGSFDHVADLVRFVEAQRP